MEELFRVCDHSSMDGLETGDSSLEKKTRWVRKTRLKKLEHHFLKKQQQTKRTIYQKHFFPRMILQNIRFESIYFRHKLE